MAAPKSQKLSPGLRGLLALGTPDEWLLNVVDGYLVDQDKGRTDPGWFHPSSLANPCDAYLAFEFLGTARRRNENPVSIRVLDHGHDRDRAWKRYLAESGLSVVSNERRTCVGCGAEEVDGRHMCIPALRIRGECDDIVAHPQTARRYIAEIKTKRESLWKPLTAPDREHYIQVQVYMVGHGIEDALVVYENSNTKEVKVRHVRYDQEAWAGIKSRVERILEQLSTDITPTRTPSKWESSCNFYSICSMANFPELVDEYRRKQGLA